MNKQECIKILIDVQNKLKGIKNINNESIQTIQDKIKKCAELINDCEEVNKMYTFILVVCVGNTIYNLYNDDLENALIGVFSAIVTYIGIIIFSIKINIDKNLISKLENEHNQEFISSEISSIEYAIEFLNSLTKEEEEEYLRLKIDK